MSDPVAAETTEAAAVQDRDDAPTFGGGANEREVSPAPDFGGRTQNNASSLSQMADN